MGFSRLQWVESRRSANGSFGWEADASILQLNGSASPGAFLHAKNHKETNAEIITGGSLNPLLCPAGKAAAYQSSAQAVS
jgi:hypothetical protein